MRIGFTGAHRSGKTTIATQIAEEFNLPLIQSSASSVAAKLGVDFSRHMTIDQRLDYQEAVLDVMREDYLHQDSFVSDRTPLDAAAYLLADVVATTAPDEETQERILAYVNDALVLTHQCFNIMVLVPPALPYVTEPGKPPLNVAYQEHHHFLVSGMLADVEHDFRWTQVGRTTIDRQQRVDWVKAEIFRLTGITRESVSNLDNRLHA